jgi:acyl-CoA synthetase (AMP-forming)/AMP-acid ligase II
MHYLRTHDPERVAALDLSRVRVIFNGAEPIAADLCREFVAALAPAKLAPNVMFPVYGLAEASLAVTFPEPGSPLRTVRLAGSAHELVRLGRAVQDCEVHIADEIGAAVAEGVTGRILIRGANVSPDTTTTPH